MRAGGRARAMCLYIFPSLCRARRQNAFAIEAKLTHGSSKQGGVGATLFLSYYTKLTWKWGSI